MAKLKLRLELVTKDFAPSGGTGRQAEASLGCIHTDRTKVLANINKSAQRMKKLYDI